MLWLSELWVVATALAVTLLAAICDARTGSIPNALTLPTLLFAPLVHFALGGSAALQLSLAGAAACAIVPGAFFARDAMGGGDLKLFVALGALRGPRAGLELQVLSLVIAALTAMIWLAHRRELGAMLRRSFALVTTALRIRPLRSPQTEPDAQLLTSIRLGVPIFVACACSIALEVVP